MLRRSRVILCRSNKGLSIMSLATALASAHLRSAPVSAWARAAQHEAAPATTVSPRARRWSARPVGGTVEVVVLVLAASVASLLVSCVVAGAI
jgi:hypothetical protein